MSGYINPDASVAYRIWENTPAVPANAQLMLFTRSDTKDIAGSGPMDYLC
jgi:hypothetical protein